MEAKGRSCRRSRTRPKGTRCNLARRAGTHGAKAFGSRFGGRGLRQRGQQHCQRAGQQRRRRPRRAVAPEGGRGGRCHPLRHLEREGLHGRPLRAHPERMGGLRVRFQERAQLPQAGGGGLEQQRVAAHELRRRRLAGHLSR